MKRKLLNLLMMLTLGVSGAWAEDKYTILYGVPTYDTDGTTVLSVANQIDFTGDAHEATDKTFTDGNGNTAKFNIGGSVLVAPNSSGSAWTNYFTEAKTYGKVYFNADYTNSSNATQAFQIVDSKGNEIFGSAQNNTGSNATQIVGYFFSNDNEGKQTVSNWVRLPRKAGYNINLVIDLDTRKVSYSMIVSSGNGTSSTVSGEFDLPESITDVKGLKVNKKTYESWIDNVALYSVEPVATPINYTVNAIDASGNVIKTLSSGICYQGDGTVIYYPYAFNKDGIWYTTSAATYGVAINTAGTKTVTYTSNTSMVFFSEGEGGYANVWIDGTAPLNYSSGTVCNNNDGRASGGALNTQDRGLTIGTLPAGHYRLSVMVVGKNKRGINLRSGSTIIATVDNSLATNGLKSVEFTLENQTTNLLLNGNNSGTKSTQLEDIDYFYIVKTGEIFTPGEDATRAIVNATPENIKSTVGWTLEGNGNRPFVYGQLFENWNDNYSDANFNYYQTITGLPNGYYVVGADVFSDQGEINGAVGLYASSNGNEVHAPVTQLATLETVATPAILVQDGTLKIGVKNWATIAANWFHANNFTLTYFGPAITKTLGTTGFGTFSATYNVAVPDGVKVYTSTLDGETLTATADESIEVIPANTGVIFKGEAGAEVTFAATTEEGESITTALTAAPNGVDGDGSTIFGLLKNQNTFAKVMSGVKLANNSAYLQIPASAKGGVKFVIMDDAPTGMAGVSESKAQTKAVKYIENGKLLIKTANGIINAAGAMVK